VGGFGGGVGGSYDWLPVMGVAGVL